MTRLTTLVLVALVLTSCSGLPMRSPDMEGVLREVGTGDSTLLVEAVPLHVEHVPAARYGDRVVVRITARTRILKDIGGVQETTPFRDVVAGDRSRVQVWFTGPVTRSYPARAEAEAVLYWRLAP